MTARAAVAGLRFDMLTSDQLVGHVEAAIRRGDGGTIVTPNVDICRKAARDPGCRDLVAGASLVLPDGMPLLWAARIAGRPLVERIAGADLIFTLCRSAAANGWAVYLLGGLPGSDGAPGMAELAAERLRASYPGLIVAGSYAPPASLDPVADDIGQVRKELAETAPRIVFVGLGFPKQERLIARLAPGLPGAWFIGCGAAIPFAAGSVRRAPGWMQRSGLEWCYRLISEPRRLFRRYLIEDLPFAARLLAGSAWARFARRGR